MRNNCVSRYHGIVEVARSIRVRSTKFPSKNNYLSSNTHQQLLLLNSNITAIHRTSTWVQCAIAQLEFKKNPGQEIIYRKVFVF